MTETFVFFLRTFHWSFEKIASCVVHQTCICIQHMISSTSNLNVGVIFGRNGLSTNNNKQSWEKLNSSNAMYTEQPKQKMHKIFFDIKHLSTTYFFPYFFLLALSSEFWPIIVRYEALGLSLFENITKPLIYFNFWWVNRLKFFSVTRRSRSDGSHWVSQWVTH